MAKIHRKPHTRSLPDYTSWRECVTFDLRGLKVPSWDGNVYSLTFTDLHMRHESTSATPTKDAVLSALQANILMYGKMQRIRVDSAGEYTAAESYDDLWGLHNRFSKHRKRELTEQHPHYTAQQIRDIVRQEWKAIRDHMDANHVSERQLDIKKLPIDISRPVFDGMLSNSGGTPASSKLLDENDDHCSKCKRKGHLVCCVTCLQSWHLQCIRVNKADLPDVWRCPVCVENGVPLSAPMQGDGGGMDTTLQSCNCTGYVSHGSVNINELTNFDELSELFMHMNNQEVWQNVTTMYVAGTPAICMKAAKVPKPNVPKSYEEAVHPSNPQQSQWLLTIQSEWDLMIERDVFEIVDDVGQSRLPCRWVLDVKDEWYGEREKTRIAAGGH